MILLSLRYCGLSSAVSFKLNDCLCYLFFQMNSVLFTLKGQSYSACIHFNGTRCKKVLDFATKWKELQCTQEDVAIRFLKQSPQPVKDAEYHQCCYQRFCDKARYFFLEFEILTWNEFVNLIFVTVC